MPYIRLTHTYVYSGQQCANVYHYATNNIAPTESILGQAADDFIDDILPAINGVQVTQVTNSQVVAYAPNVGYSVERTAPGGGALASIATGNIPPDIVLLVKRSVGVTQRNDNGQIYTGNRPIRRGRFYLSGLAKDNMIQTGFDPATFSAAWTAFSNAMVASVQAGGNDWFPVVLGEELSATLTKDARPLSFAQITGVDYDQFTNLSTRDV